MISGPSFCFPGVEGGCGARATEQSMRDRADGPPLELQLIRERQKPPLQGQLERQFPSAPVRWEFPTILFQDATAGPSMASALPCRTRLWPVGPASLLRGILCLTQAGLWKPKAILFWVGLPELSAILNPLYALGTIVGLEGR